MSALALHETEALRTRVDALEARVAHQDHTIDELNAVITAQWTEIERLRLAFDRLDDRMQDIGGAAPANERPPHY